MATINFLSLERASFFLVDTLFAHLLFQKIKDGVTLHQTCTTCDPKIPLLPLTRFSTQVDLQKDKRIKFGQVKNRDKSSLKKLISKKRFLCLFRDRNGLNIFLETVDLWKEAERRYACFAVACVLRGFEVKLPK